ncbi:calcineurin-like phosphoesterase family protein [Amycolatopsis echigonensis]|uniref:Calcineurin-like phosphoesterase family protein n=1 Tax=Amycolatopsis echigonensis TaxID=2576905 RepID=A0A2N3WD03_9PSEU|nr:metallophosphoesterase [Amycolatopsis niigatensis]PKV91748.1 calcineurin-like phosphoesterase family protein [Amycolatopsis niigatensis]
MPKALVVADEADERLWTPAVRSLRVDLVVAAGDLPFGYLEHLAGMLDVPCVFVPGNHDPDLSGYTRYGGLSMKDGFPTEWPGPAGGINADGRVVDVAGLRIAGLGGSIRYRDGPNQWTQRQQARRARRLELRFRWRKWRDGNGIDILLTHSPPRHLGDREDPPHQGFTCLHRTIETLQPRWLLHGHIHPHGEPVPDRVAGGTRIRNVVGYQVMEFPR